MKTITLIIAVLIYPNLCFAVEHRDIEKRFQVTPSQLIHMQGFNGTGIQFSSWDKNEVFIKLHIEVKSSEEQFEKYYFNEPMLEELRTDSSLIITYKGTGKIINIDGSFWSRLKSILSLPHTNTYSISILGEIIVPQSNSITINTSSSSITLENMKGDIRFLGSSNNLILKQCSSVQEIKNDYGTTTMEQCDGNLVLSAKLATISIDEFDGSGIINANYSKITLRKIKKDFTISSKSCEELIEELNAESHKYNISHNYSDISDYSTIISVKQIGGNLNIKGSGDKMTVEDVIGNLNIESPYTSIDLWNIKGNVELKSVPKHLKIRNEYGSATVIMPNGYSGEITIEALYGKIECNLPIKVKSLGTDCYAVGKIGDGDGSISIETTSGNVKLFQK